MKKLHKGIVEAKGACEQKEFVIYEDDQGNRFLKEKVWKDFKNQMIYKPVKLLTASDYGYYVYERI